MKEFNTHKQPMQKVTGTKYSACNILENTSFQHHQEINLGIIRQHLKILFLDPKQCQDTH
jgi:hypothetical protein